MSARGFSRSMKCRQRSPYVMGIYLDGVGSSIGEGANECSLTVGGVGDYDIAYNTAFLRAPVVIATPDVANITCSVTANATTGFTVNSYTSDTKAATDSGIHILVIGWDAADEV